MTALSRVCGPILAQTGVFVVQEAFIISSGSYTFQTKAGVKIGVTPSPNVPVKATVDASKGDSGTLTITQPTVFALKVLQPLPQGGFQIASGLGAGAASSSAYQAHQLHLATAAPGATPEAAANAAASPTTPLSLGGHVIGSIEGLAAQ